MNYGYARTSTKDQNEARQCIALEEAGVSRGKIYIDKCSGKDFNRENYQRLVRKLKPGDTLIIKSIDRLGRNYKEILEQWDILTKRKGIDIAIIDMPLLDTRRNKDLTGTLIADIVLQLLSYVAETERSFIRQRQAEGIRIALENGVQFGRKPKERPDEFRKYKQLDENKEISAREAAKRLGIAFLLFLLSGGIRTLFAGGITLIGTLAVIGLAGYGVFYLAREEFIWNLLVSIVAAIAAGITGGYIFARFLADPLSRILSSRNVLMILVVSAIIAALAYLIAGKIVESSNVADKMMQDQRLLQESRRAVYLGLEGQQLNGLPINTYLYCLLHYQDIIDPAGSLPFDMSSNDQSILV